MNRAFAFPSSLGVCWAPARPTVRDEHGEAFDREFTEIWLRTRHAETVRAHFGWANRSAVYKHIERLRLPTKRRRPFTQRKPPNFRERLRSTYLTLDCNVSATARQLGVGRGTVYWHLKRLGIEVTGTSWRDQARRVA